MKRFVFLIILTAALNSAGAPKPRATDCSEVLFGLSRLATFAKIDILVRENYYSATNMRFYTDAAAILFDPKTGAKLGVDRPTFMASLQKSMKIEPSTARKLVSQATVAELLFEYKGKRNGSLVRIIEPTDLFVKLLLEVGDL